MGQMTKTNSVKALKDDCENLFVQYFLLTGFSFINIINTVMPRRSVFVVGWALN